MFIRTARRRGGRIFGRLGNVDRALLPEHQNTPGLSALVRQFKRSWRDMGQDNPVGGGGTVGRSVGQRQADVCRSGIRPRTRCTPQIRHPVHTAQARANGLNGTSLSLRLFQPLPHLRVHLDGPIPVMWTALAPESGRRGWVAETQTPAASAAAGVITTPHCRQSRTVQGNGNLVCNVVMLLLFFQLEIKVYDTVVGRAGVYLSRSRPGFGNRKSKYSQK